MDSLRGIAILLVVHTHVVASIFAKYPDAPEALRQFTAALSPFRMPVLMFLSGLLVHHSMQKGLGRYVTGKVTNIAYPFLIWTLVMFLVYLAREAVLSEPSPVDLLTALTVSPVDHLWFLHHLFGFYLLAVLAMRYRTLGVVVFCTAIALMASSEYGLSRLGSLLLFFLVGVWIGPAFARLRDLAAYPTVAASALVSLFMICWVAGPEGGLRGYGVVPSMATIFAIPLLVRVASAAESIPGSGIIESLGRHSLVVYLAHVPFAMALPVLIRHFYDGSPLWIYPPFMLATLAACMALAMLRQRLAAVDLLFSGARLQASLAARRKGSAGTEISEGRKGP